MAIAWVEAGSAGAPASGSPMALRYEPGVTYRMISARGGANLRSEFLRYFQPGPKGWADARFRATPETAFERLYDGEATTQWAALDVAMRIEPVAARDGASYGFGQIMGFNHSLAGYDSAEHMFLAMSADAEAQLDGLVRFVASQPDALEALRREDYVSFGRIYNGPGGEHYAGWLEAALQTFEAEVLPSCAGVANAEAF